MGRKIYVDHIHERTNPGSNPTPQPTGQGVPHYNKWCSPHTLAGGKGGAGLGSKLGNSPYRP